MDPFSQCSFYGQSTFQSYIFHDESLDLIFSEGQDGSEGDCKVVAHLFSPIHCFRPVLLTLFLYRKTSVFIRRNDILCTLVLVECRESSQQPTFPSSLHLVNIAMVVSLYSQIIRQKSPTVPGTGAEMEIK